MPTPEKKEKTSSTKPLYSLLILISLYLMVQGIALNVGLNFIPKIISGEIAPIVEEPESPESSGQIFLYILIMTGVILILLKFKLGIMIRLFMFLAILMGMSITLWSFFPQLWFLLTIPLYLLFLWKRENALLVNVILILTIAGMGGYLGASLHFIPSLLLLLALSIYDIVAVFGTKHMVTLAKGAQGKIPMFSVPIRKKFMGLGTGDLAIPAVFSVSVLQDFSMSHSLLTLLGGLLGLISLFFYIIQREKVVLPALPPITIGLVLGFLVSLVIL